MKYAGLIRNDLAAAPGVSVSFFTQGCPHGCKGCHNPQTHDFNGGRDESIEKIASMIDSDPLLKGVTLSGGEPFMQAGKLVKLLNKIKNEKKKFLPAGKKGFRGFCPKQQNGVKTPSWRILGTRKCSQYSRQINLP